MKEISFKKGHGTHDWSRLSGKCFPSGGATCWSDADNVTHIRRGTPFDTGTAKNLPLYMLWSVVIGSVLRPVPRYNTVRASQMVCPASGVPAQEASFGLCSRDSRSLEGSVGLC